MKLTFTHILCLVSLIVAQYSDMDAFACDSHDLIENQPQINMPASGHHGMDHEMTNHSTTDSYTNENMDCCDDCTCAYANCHSSMIMALNITRVEFDFANSLNSIAQLINDKNIPSHPYRPPIV